MKTYQTIQPEVIVGLGEKTEFLEKEAPFLTVIKLHIQLEDWLGDDLMECHPCYIVTEKLKTGLQTTKFTGFEFSEMIVTKDEYFNDNYQLNKSLPEFYWMKIIGKQDFDDIIIGPEKSLLVGEELLDYLKKNFTLNYMDVKPERNEFDDLLDQMIAESKKNK